MVKVRVGELVEDPKIHGKGGYVGIAVQEVGPMSEVGHRSGGKA